MHVWDDAENWSGRGGGRRVGDDLGAKCAGQAPADTRNAAPAAQSAPAPAPTAAPAGPAPIRLAVDATQAPQKILHAHMEFPVQAGALTLYYPEWIPGEHMPDGPIIQVAGIKFTRAARRFRGGAIWWRCFRFIWIFRRA